MSPRPDSRKRVADGVYKDSDGRLWIAGDVEYEGHRRTFDVLATVQHHEDALDLARIERRALIKAYRLGKTRSETATKRYTVREWTDHVYDGRQITDTARSTYYSNASRWLDDLGDRDIRSITPDDIERVWRKILKSRTGSPPKPLKPRTLRAIYVTLATPFKAWAKKVGEMSVLERSDCALPRVKADHVVDLDAKRAVPLLEAFERHDHFTYHLIMWATGVRGEELRKLTEAHIIEQDDGRWLEVIDSKTGTRKLPLTDFVARVLESHVTREAIESGQRFFPHTARTYQAAFREIRGSLPKGTGAHKLRAAFSTVLARLGVREEVTRHLVGHAKRGVTQKHYLAIAPEELREAMELATEYVVEGFQRFAETGRRDEVLKHADPAPDPAPSDFSEFEKCEFPNSNN